MPLRYGYNIYRISQENLQSRSKWKIAKRMVHRNGMRLYIGYLRLQRRSGWQLRNRIHSIIGCSPNNVTSASRISSVTICYKTDEWPFPNQSRGRRVAASGVFGRYQWRDSDVLWRTEWINLRPCLHSNLSGCRLQRIDICRR